MTNLYTQEQVADLCIDVGFNPYNARIASAIAVCEGFTEAAYLKTVETGIPHTDFDAVGDQDLANDVWGYSYGAFQIRSLRADKGTGRFRDEERLLRPRFNCRAARHIKITSGWRAWTTYKNGDFKAYLQDLFPPPPNTYVVLGGETLSSIGAKLDVPWQELARLNNLHAPYTIYIGQHLTIP